jgi:gliding motility-associated-like protein
VEVNCFDCPPVHRYTEDFFGNIAWIAPTCSGDTLFCSNIPQGQLDDFTVTDNFAPFTKFDACGALTGFRFDTGYHEVRLFNSVTTCDYVVKFFYDCRDAARDTLLVRLNPGEKRRVCLDTTILTPPIISIFDICPEINGNNTRFTYDERLWCIELTATNPGVDTLCIELCNGDGDCETINILADVRDPEQRVRVYNGLSPNGDGTNDNWVIGDIEAYPGNEVFVYNRWGNLVYRRKNYDNSNGWDGRWEGRALPDGAYFYFIDLADGKKPVSGYLQLMR